MAGESAVCKKASYCCSSGRSYEILMNEMVLVTVSVAGPNGNVLHSCRSRDAVSAGQTAALHAIGYLTESSTFTHHREGSPGVAGYASKAKFSAKGTCLDIDHMRMMASRATAKQDRGTCQAISSGWLEYPVAAGKPFPSAFC